MYLIAATEWKRPQNPKGVSLSSYSFLWFQYIFCSMLWLLGVNKRRHVYLFMFMCSCLHVHGSVAVELVHGRAWLRGTVESLRKWGGGRHRRGWGGICLGHAYNASILSCRPTADISFGYPFVPSSSDSSWQMFSLLPIKNQVLILHITEQVNMMPQGQNGCFCSPFSANLPADITLYHPPPRTMFRSVRISMPMWFIAAVTCGCVVDAAYNDKEIDAKALYLFIIYLLTWMLFPLRGRGCIQEKAGCTPGQVASSSQGPMWGFGASVSCSRVLSSALKVPLHLPLLQTHLQNFILNREAERLRTIFFRCCKHPRAGNSDVPDDSLQWSKSEESENQRDSLYLISEKNE